MSFELVLFFGLAILAVVFAALMLLSKNAVHSAMYLIGNFGCVAVLYLLLNAPFIGMVQIAVYAGAIMVLFLFVIMLLGAEQTTDTSRRFRWLTGAATVLAGSLFMAIVSPLVIGGVNLPRPAPADATLRLIHAGGVPNNTAVNVTLSGGTLAEPLIVENASFGDVTDFYTVGAGTYNVLVQGVDGSAIMPPAQVTVNAGEKLSAVVYGELNLDAGTFPQIVTIPQSAAPGISDDTRILLFNAYSAKPLALVDLGPNALVDLRKRPQMGADGQTVKDAANNDVLVDGLGDTIVVNFTEQNAIPVPTTYEAGLNNLALVDSDFNIVKTLFDYDLPRSSEQLIFVGSDYLETVTTQATYRAYIPRNAAITIETLAPFGSPASIGEVLFTDYLLPVNVVGILLLVALVGVVVLTRPETENTERRVVRRRKVSRPLTSVISTQTGGDVTEDTPRLPTPQSGD